MLANASGGRTLASDQISSRTAVIAKETAEALAANNPRSSRRKADALDSATCLQPGEQPCDLPAVGRHEVTIGFWPTVDQTL
jgi:hypothetical protein